MRVRQLWYAALVLGGLLMVGFGLWVMRLAWLPWLLQLALQEAPINRLRYEEADWKGRTIQLRKVLLQRGAWHLHIDTLTLRLRWRPALYLNKALLSRAWASPGHSDVSAAGQSPLQLLRSAFRQLNRLDTLLISSLMLSDKISCHFSKSGDLFQLNLHYDSLTLTMQGREQNSNYAWEILPASGLGPATYAFWEAAQGTLKWSADTLQLSFRLRALQFYHPRMAARPLFYDSVGGVCHLAFSGSVWAFSFRPEALPLKFTLEAQGRGQDSFRIQLQIPPQAFQAYLQSFPQGFFSVLSRARLEGTSALDLALTYNPSLPETLDLRVRWQTQNFQIVSWAGLNPLSLREPFLYHPWRSGRTILLGPENPKYLTYYQIHPYVLFALLHSEDGGFFYHQGFHRELFLKALLENWRCKCFRRGAGTITMQLVRNLLLSRQKTLARKVEEIFLTALIERFRLLSKERILELYLNMVEWGPEVYGLSEASEFYFAKAPYDLTLPEAIFLGLLLPSPRGYRYFIDDSTHCARKTLESAFQRIGYFVVKANYVPEESLSTLTPERVCLRGPARRIFLPPDSLREEE